MTGGYGGYAGRQWGYMPQPQQVGIRPQMPQVENVPISMINTNRQTVTPQVYMSGIAGQGVPSLAQQLYGLLMAAPWFSRIGQRATDLNKKPQWWMGGM